MRTYLILAVVLLVSGFVLSTGNGRSDDGGGEAASYGFDRNYPDGDTAQDVGFAVLELFTSEGCSSCPPAESLLNTIAAEAERTGRPVYALAFHVDYWNRLGWKDRFSRPEYSARQRKYAEAMKLRSVYTPQMVLNGSVEFVGSNAETARSRITDALDDTISLPLRLSLTQEEEDVIASYVVETKKEMVVNLALVESALVTDIPRGENAGRTLHHDNVVRLFVEGKTDTEGRGYVRFSLPEGVDAEHSAVIAYVQEPSTMQVLGAARVAMR